MPRKKSPAKVVEEKLEWVAGNFSEFVYSTYQQVEDILIRNIKRDPTLSNALLKEIRSKPIVKSVDEVIEMIRRPYLYEKELSGLSQYLASAVMPYNRILDHFTKILLYNHELQPLTPPPTDTDGITTYLNGRNRCLEWLRKFGAREQFENVTKIVLLDGVKYVYVRQNNDHIELQELPMEFCKITGRTNLGFTFAFDMSFFDRWGNIQRYAPEFAEWYDELVQLRKDKSLQVSPWYPMPPDKAFVFKFDDTDATIIPPLAGVFSDAIQINEYKNIMKARAILDVFAILYQKVPLNKDGKPVLSAKEATQIAAAIEQSLPAGAHTVASPNEPELIKFSQSAGEKDVIPSGEERFWASSGVSGQQYGGGDKGAVAQKYSNISDYGYVRHLYYQYERFINFMLSKVSAKYRFGVFFHGNLYTNQDDIKNYMSVVAIGAPVLRLFAMCGYDPGQAENCLKDEELIGIKRIMVPPSNMNQPTSEPGRPSESLEGLTPTGEAMREQAGSGSEAM